MTSTWRVVGAVLRKDLACLWPAVLLGIAVFASDVFMMRLELRSAVWVRCFGEKSLATWTLSIARARSVDASH